MSIPSARAEGRSQSSLSRAVAAVLVALCGWGCQPSFDNRPAFPEHSDEEDGAHHAPGKDFPFLCRDDNSPRGLIACPTQRLPDNQLSCDAVGCHGSYDYAAGRDLAFRVLGGSEGPSCNTCHGKEWSTIGRDPNAPIDWTKVDEKDEEDEKDEKDEKDND